MNEAAATAAVAATVAQIEGTKGLAAAWGELPKSIRSAFRERLQADFQALPDASQSGPVPELG